jgi:hypothetical protein
MSHLKKESFFLDLHPIDRKRFLVSPAGETVHLFVLRAIRGPDPERSGHLGFSPHDDYHFGKHVIREVSQYKIGNLLS